MIDSTRGKTNSAGDVSTFEIGCAPLLGFRDLKEQIRITEEQVECPVLGCRENVPRQRKFFSPQEKYRCPRHRICISPSTFEYPSEAHNILDRSPEELHLLKRVKRSKRESRIARDNSEDALSWNIFRYLQRSNLLAQWLQRVSGHRSDAVEDVFFWSCSGTSGRQWELLNKARAEFGEEINRGSEPDIAIVTEHCVCFVEAKLTAPNKTSGNKEALARRLANPKKYTQGGNAWFSNVFASDYGSMLKDQKYELMRFWLLGSWIAKEASKDFYLVNLVCDQKETSITFEFCRHLHETDHRRFNRQTWEGIYRLVRNSNSPAEERQAFLSYLENKTIGYGQDGRLKKAFNT